MRTKLIAMIAAGALAFIGVVILLYMLLSKSGLEAAIADFEDRDFEDAIITLNELIPNSDYESAEKIFYYRARALNGLADELDEDYDDELKKAALGLEDTLDFKKASASIKRTLDKINAKTNADLEIVLDRPRSSIVTRGKFHDEFVARYKGSNLIEDLDFEQLQKITKIQEGDKPLRSIVQFYQKYNNTQYVAHLVKMIFNQLQQGGKSVSEFSNTVLDILVSYGLKYPTSPEINMIYTCTGDGVNIRNSPGVNAQRVGAIPKDAILLQLEKSMDTSQVGEVRDYWYRVADLSGQKGWIFGKFMKPFDISNYKIETVDEKWTLTEDFASWTDSNTPESWQHIEGAVKNAISFVNIGSSRMAVLDSNDGGTSGLYARYNASRAFNILIKARYTGGNSFTLLVYSLGSGDVFSLALESEMINICGRTIPLHTSDWHDYRLISEDGKFASLSVDGEIISGRIPTVKKEGFTMRGIYALCSARGETSKGEVQYIKAR